MDYLYLRRMLAQIQRSRAREIEIDKATNLELARKDFFREDVSSRCARYGRFCAAAAAVAVASLHCTALARLRASNQSWAGSAQRTLLSLSLISGAQS